MKTHFFLFFFFSLILSFFSLLLPPMPIPRRFVTKLSPSCTLSLRCNLFSRVCVLFIFYQEQPPLSTACNHTKTDSFDVQKSNRCPRRRTPMVRLSLKEGV
ncbi:hypothetical protein I3843_14G048600 [Carya illinoinensis]|nr:hypothetical protein I3843_14G048600 [Carya illinoinensis]